MLYNMLIKANIYQNEQLIDLHQGLNATENAFIVS